MDRVIQIAVNAAALWVAVQLIDGIDFVGEWWELLVVAGVFSLVNTFVRPILRILTLPLTIVTLGIFLLVINAAMLLLTGALAGAVGIGFAIAGFGPAFLGAIVIALVGLVLSLAIGGGRAVTRFA